MINGCLLRPIRERSPGRLRFKDDRPAGLYQARTAARRTGVGSSLLGAGYCAWPDDSRGPYKRTLWHRRGLNLMAEGAVSMRPSPRPPAPTCVVLESNARQMGSALVHHPPALRCLCRAQAMLRATPSLVGSRTGHTGIWTGLQDIPPSLALRAWNQKALAAMIYSVSELRPILSLLT